MMAAPEQRKPVKQRAKSTFKPYTLRPSLWRPDLQRPNRFVGNVSPNMGFPLLDCSFVASS
jgi:hypothetical protein